MQSSSRIGDMSTGHSPDNHYYPPHPLLDGSGDVFVNGRACATIGSAYEEHQCQNHGGNDHHSSTQAQGSSTVFINGKAAARVGDYISCGDMVAEGSSDVFIG